MLAMVGLARACAGNSTEVMLCDSPSSQLRLVPGAGADPQSSVRTWCKGEARLTDLNQSQSSLDAQLSTSSDPTSHQVENRCDCSVGAGGAGRMAV